MAVNAISLDSVGSSRGSHSEAVASLLRPKRFFGVITITAKRYGSMGCGISSLVAAGPIDLFSASIGTVRRVGATT